MQFNSTAFNSVEFNGWEGVEQQETVVVELADGVRWRLRVVLGGVDVSERLTGVVSIDREEGGARMAKLNLLPPPGEFDVDTLTGKALFITRQRLYGGVIESETLRFTGETLRPGIDAFTKVVSVTASCVLQKRIELMSIEAINALLPTGYWSAAVFGELEKHWQYCKDRCSTMPGNLDSAPDGSLRYTPWQASSVPHFSLSADEIIDGSMSLRPADASQLINHIEIELEYRYTRLRHRSHTLSWTHPTSSFCEWLAESTELPTQSMLVEALEQGGWAVIGAPMLTVLPPSMPDPCGSGGAWINRFTDDPHLLSFIATVAKRTSQTFTERYRLALTASGSVVSFGIQPSRERYSDDVEFDAGSWEDLPPTSSPDGATSDGSGDAVIDKDEPGRRENALRTAMHAERVRMLASHRLARYDFQTPITDSVYDTTHTFRAVASGLTVQGKAARVQEAWDMDAGTEIATIELAISRGGMPVIDSVISPPGRPVFDLGPAPSGSTVLATQLGGRVGAPEYDEELASFSGNYSWSADFVEKYPRRLQFDTPDIEGRYRDPVEAEAVAAFQVNIPTDLLLVEVL